MSFLRSTNIRSRILATLLLAVGSVAAIFVAVWRLSIEPALRIGVARQQKEVAQRAADQIGDFLEDRIKGLLAVAELARFWETGVEDRERALEHLMKIDPQIWEVSVVDRTGRETARLSRLRVYTEKEPAGFAPREKFRQAMQGEVYVGPVYQGAPAEPFVTVAVPVGFTEAKIRGAVVAEISLKTLWSSVSYVEIGRSGNVFVVDDRGKLIAHPDYSKIPLGTDLSQVAEVKKAIDHSISDDDFGEIHQGVDGRRVITAYAAVPRPQWGVIVEEPADTALAEVSKVERAALFILLLTLVGAMGLSALVSERIARPVRGLEEGAKRIASGDLAHRLDIRTGDEIESLAREFNRMAGALRASYQSLEDKVAERTQEISSLYAALAPLTPADSAEAMLERVIERLMHATGAEAALVRLRDRATDSFLIAAQRGFPDHYLAMTASIKPGSAVESVFKIGAPIVCSDIASDPRFKGKIQLQVGFRSCALLPLKVSGEIRGIIHLASRQIGHFRAEQQDHLMTMANQMAIAIENRELLEDTERRAKEQEALNTVAKAVTQSLRLEELFEIALDKVLEVTGRDRMSLRLKDPLSGRLALSAHRGFSDGEVEDLRKRPSHRWIEQVLATRQPAVIDEAAVETDRQALLLNSGSVAWIPIQAREHVVGVMGISAVESFRFSRRELDFLAAIGHVVGIAVENAWLFEESQRQEKIQRLLKELSQDITSLDISALFQKVADKVQEFFKVDIADIRLLTEGDIPALVGSSGMAPDRLYKRGASTGRSRWIAQNRRPLIIPDMTKESAIPRGDTVRELGIRGYLAVPFFSKSGEVIGILRALTYEPREFSESELDLLQQLVNGTAIALANARLFEETERRAHEQAVLNAIAMTTSQSLHLGELLQIALEKVLEATGREQGYIRLKDPITGDLTLAAHRGISEQFVQTLLHERTPGGKSDQVFASGEPLVINDPDSSVLKEQTRREGTRAIGWFPLKVRGTVVGIMNVLATRSIAFQPREVELLKAIGNVIGVALENARLFGETQRSLAQVKALREIDQAITSSLDLRTVLDVLMEKIDLVLPYSAVTVRLFDKERGLLEPVVCRNLDERDWKATEWRAGRGLANVVFETRAPLIIQNARADARVLDRAFYRKHQLTSYVGVPLIVKDEILGVLGFYTKAEHDFTGEEVEFLMTLAGRAAIAIHNAGLHEETERRRREAEELARVARSLTETLDMSAVGERIVTSVRELFGVRASMLRLLQPDGSLRALASSGEGFLQDSGVDLLPVGTGIVSRAIAEERAIWSPDVLNDPEIRLTDQMREYQIRSGNSAMIAVPLRAHETIIGSLGCLDRTGRVYTDSEVALLQTLADEAALALENARLYKETQIRESQLQETNLRLSALHAVTAAASQSLDTDRVLNSAIGKITEIFGFDATQIHIYDERKDEMHLNAYFETQPHRFVSVQAFRRGQGIVGKVAESGKPLIFEDVLTDPLYRQLSRTKTSSRFGYHFFAVFPIKGKQKTLGTLACTGVDPRTLSSGETQLLEAIADQVAVAIENAGLYAEVRQRLQELQQKTEELQRANKVKDEFLSVMSHELRTPINVVMGYAAMIKDGLVGQVSAEQNEALAKLMARGREQLSMIDGILQVTQIEAHKLSVEQDEVKLGEFLDELKSDYGALRANKRTGLVWQYPSELPAITTDRKKLRQILSNLINNAIKFTADGGVTVSARVVEGTRQKAEGGSGEGKTELVLACCLVPPASTPWVEFTVADTGVGIPQESLSVIFEKFRQVDSSETRRYAGIGIGLYIVKHFSELLGGKVEVESEPGRGSTFTVTLPCADQSAVSGRQAAVNS